MSVLNELVIENDPVKKATSFFGFFCLKTDLFTAKFSGDLIATANFVILAKFNLVLSTSQKI